MLVSFWLPCTTRRPRMMQEEEVLNTNMVLLLLPPGSGGRKSRSFKIPYDGRKDTHKHTQGTSPKAAQYDNIIQYQTLLAAAYYSAALILMSDNLKQHPLSIKQWHCGAVLFCNSLIL